MNVFVEHYTVATSTLRDILHEIEFPKFRLKVAPHGEEFRIIEDEYTYGLHLPFTLLDDAGQTQQYSIVFYVESEFVGSEEQSFTFSVYLEEDGIVLSEDAEFGVLVDVLKNKKATRADLTKAFYPRFS